MEIDFEEMMAHRKRFMTKKEFIVNIIYCLGKCKIIVDVDEEIINVSVGASTS